MGPWQMNQSAPWDRNASPLCVTLKTAPAIRSSSPDPLRRGRVRSPRHLGLAAAASAWAHGYTGVHGPNTARSLATTSGCCTSRVPSAGTRAWPEWGGLLQRQRQQPPGHCPQYARRRHQCLFADGSVTGSTISSTSAAFSVWDRSDAPARRRPSRPARSEAGTFSRKDYGGTEPRRKGSRCDDSLRRILSCHDGVAVLIY
jgi:hypothetical protein